MPGLAYVLPNYTWGLVALPLTQAAAVAADRLDRPLGRRILLGAAVVGAGAIVWLVRARHAPTWNKSFGRVLDAAIRTHHMAQIVVFPVLALLLALALFGIARTRFARLAVFAPLAVVTVEGMLAMKPLIGQATSSVLASPPSPAVRFLQDRLADDRFRLTGYPTSEGRLHTLELVGLPDLREVAALPLRRYVEYLNAIRASNDFTVFTAGNSTSALLDLAAVRFVAVSKADKLDSAFLGNDPVYQPILQTDDDTIFEDTMAVPRARLVRQFDAVPTEKDALAKIKAIASTPHLKPDHRDVIEGDPPALPTADPPASTEDATIVPQADPAKLVIDVRADQPAYLVVADAYFPGWRATVDGSRTRIYPADLLFRAVQVPAGAHRVVFTFVSSGLREGLVLAFFAALAIAGIFWIRRRA
jgi:hypothetical protein